MKIISYTFLHCSLLLLFFSLPLSAADSSVAVSSTGSASIRPDMVEFTVLLTDTAPSASEATGRTAEKYRRVQDALRTQGVLAEDASSVSYGVRQQWEWDNASRRRVFKGYTSTHMLHVTVRRLENAGRVIDSSVKAGADEIQGIVFTSSRNEEVRRAALADAVRQARTDAEVMAKAANVSLGVLLDLQTAFSPFYPVGEFDAMPVRKLEAASPSTEVSPGTLVVKAKVFCRWALSR